MAGKTYRPSKVFTVDEANAYLPLVRAIMSDIVQLSRELAERRQRLDVITRGRDVSRGDPYSDELTQVREELDKDTRRLAEYVRELADLGVEPKSATEGLVDFPSMMDGRLVYLCWKYDEPEVLFWHELDAGFAGRQSLTVDSVSEHDADVGGGLFEA